MTTIKAALKNLIARAACHGGAAACLRKIARRPGARRGFHVFCYHRIGEGRGPLYPGVALHDFEACCAFLARHYRVLPLAELAERSRNREPLADALAITFDDGYRDNLDLALPVLEKYGLPATVFLATSAIGTDQPLWHDRVACIVEKTRQDRLVLEVGDREVHLPLATLPARLEAVLHACRALKEVPEAEKVEAVESLRVQAGGPDYSSLAGDMLDWDDVRAMSRRNITFGGHTVNHAILTRLPLEEAKQEIREGAHEIEAETDLPCNTFAYPNGDAADFNPDIEEFIESEGFVCAGSRGFEANLPGGNPFDLRRWTPHPCSTAVLALKMELSARV